MPEGEIFDTFL